MNQEFKQNIAKAKQMALLQVIRFLEVEAEHADIRDIKVATDIIKNIETQEVTEDSNVNVLVQTLATKFNLPADVKELQKLYNGNS